MKITKKMLNDFEKAIKAWVCPDSLTSDKSMVECYKKDRRELIVVLNNLRKGNFQKAQDKLYWLDTIVRDQVPYDVYNYVMDEKWKKELPLTEKQKTIYIKNGYGACPKCKARDIEGGMLEVDNNQAWQSLTCNECGFNYRDVYTLTNVEEIS